MGTLCRLGAAVGDDDATDGLDCTCGLEVVFFVVGTGDAFRTVAVGELATLGALSLGLGPVGFLVGPGGDVLVCRCGGVPVDPPDDAVEGRLA